MAGTILGYDSVNRLRSVEYTEYFRPMGITQDQRDQRIAYATALGDGLSELLAWAAIKAQYGTLTRDDIFDRLMTIYAAALASQPDVQVDAYLEKHMRRSASFIADTTVKKVGNQWFFSADRAEFIAENDANDIFDYQEFQDARRQGKRTKTWNTMQDKKVRDYHKAAQGLTVGIGDYFYVGGEYGLFPHDTEHFSPENTVNCRCWLTFA